jgi:DNA processing protein
LDTGYPYLLSQITDPPFLLYYKGTLPTQDQKLVAVVGMRTPTHYGQIVTNKLAEGLARAGCVIVSGLAYGIDSLAHTAATKNNCPTIAVLGGGIDEKSFYPKSNLNLAEQIVKTGGCIISEYPPFTSPQKHFFIARNRIVAGLSELTLITEAKKKSGSLITADFAISENRTVAAVMGSILESSSEGTNALIKNGASPITSLEDLLDLLNLQPSTSENVTIELSELEGEVLNQLSYEPLHIDLLSEKLDLPISTILTTLTFLELKKLILKSSNNQFSKL